VQLIDRVSERAALDHVLDAARNGLSGALVVHGEAGLGKTTLLRYAVEAAADMQHTLVSGVEAEMDLGFAALHRLLLPFLGRRETLPVPQRDALAAAFGLVAGTPPDRFVVSLAALTLLADAATDRPIVCVVDDAQWLDRESLDALAFVARRLYADGIVMLFGERAAADQRTILHGIPDLHVGALTNEHALELLDSAVSGPVERQVARRIVAEANGSPMAVVELAGELTADQLSGRQMLPALLPLSRGLEAHFLGQVRSLPADTQTFMLVAATETSGDPGLVAEVATRLGLPADAAYPAVDGGLVVLHPLVEFRHALIRSAVYRGAAEAERRRVHTAVADAIDPAQHPSRRAWHLAAAAVGPDESIAAELERSAERARSRGGWRAEVDLLSRAAELTPDRQRRSGRLLAAARAAVIAGSPQRAQALLELAEPAANDARLHAQALHLQGAVRSLLDVRAAPSILAAAAREYEPFDIRLARETMLEALETAMIARDAAAGTTLAEVARAALAMPRDTAAAPSIADLLLDGLATRVAVGYTEAVPILRAATSALRSEDALPEGIARWANLGSFAAQELWDEEVRRGFLERLCQQEREQGALDALRFTLVTLGDCEMWAGRFATAEAYQLEAHEISLAIDSSLGVWDLLNIQVLAWRGRDADTRAKAASLTQIAEHTGAATVAGLARVSLVVLELGAGHYPEALALARRVYEDDPLAFGNEALPGVVEAGVRADDLEAAAAALARLRERATASGTAWALGTYARSSALTADDDDAESLYLEAIELLGRTSVATELARAHLLFGEWLRRRRRRTDARAQLHTALDMFSTMGADGFAERARIELLATGETARRRTAETSNDLTPQEAQVAFLAAHGATNAEIASQLFISASAVEYHLRKVFRKLDVTSRTQLAHRMA
jgi:DNA-binding CsgD family transcriptional regulator